VNRKTYKLPCKIVSTPKIKLRDGKAKTEGSTNSYCLRWVEQDDITFNRNVMLRNKKGFLSQDLKSTCKTYVYSKNYKNSVLDNKTSCLFSMALSYYVPIKQETCSCHHLNQTNLNHVLQEIAMWVLSLMKDSSFKNQPNTCEFNDVPS
jgi:hypothetical protein